MADRHVSGTNLAQTSAIPTSRRAASRSARSPDRRATRLPLLAALRPMECGPSTMFRHRLPRRLVRQGRHVPRIRMAMPRAGIAPSQSRECRTDGRGSASLSSRGRLRREPGSPHPAPANGVPAVPACRGRSRRFGPSAEPDGRHRPPVNLAAALRATTWGGSRTDPRAQRVSVCRSGKTVGTAAPDARSMPRPCAVVMLDPLAGTVADACTNDLSDLSRDPFAWRGSPRSGGSFMSSTGVTGSAATSAAPASDGSSRCLMTECVRVAAVSAAIEGCTACLPPSSSRGRPNVGLLSLAGFVSGA